MVLFEGTSKLVGSFLLKQLSDKYQRNNIGLYRDGSLAIFTNTKSTQLKRNKDDFHKIFNDTHRKKTVFKLTQVNTRIY